MRKNSNDIEWETRQDKRLNDALMNDNLYRSLILKKDKPVQILSLPAAKWIWETSLSQAFEDIKFSFLGIEENPPVHKQMKLNAEYNNKIYAKKCRFQTTPSPFSLLHYFKMSKTSFDIIYLDWMGTWSQEKKEQVSLIFKKDLIRPRGFFIFTLMYGRGYSETNKELEKYSRMHQGFDFEYDSKQKKSYISKTRGVVNLIQSIAEKYDHKVECTYMNDYPSLRCSELSFVLKVIA